MDDTLTLKELLAVLLRRGRTAIVFLFLFALLLGSYRGLTLFRQSHAGQAGSLDSAAQFESEYELEYAQYEFEKTDLENRIAMAKLALSGQVEYNNKSLIMQVNPYSKWVTSTLLSVTNIHQVPEKASQPIYQAGQIAQQYVLYFNGIDLKSALSGYSRGETEDQYIRELIRIESRDGGFFLLETIGITEEESRHLSESLISYLFDANGDIVAATCPHSLSIISSATKTETDLKLLERQETALSSFEKYSSEIDELSSKLDNLTRPMPKHVNPNILRSAFKYALIGGFIGLFLEIILVLIHFMFSDKVEFSDHLGKQFGLPFLGSTERKGSIWNRAAMRLSGEQQWTDPDEAKAYIKKTASVLFGTTDSIAILSTADLSENDSALTALIDALNEDGRAVQFIPHAQKSPKTAEAVSSCGKVVLAERKGVSRYQDIDMAVNLSKTIGNPVSAYVIV